MGLLEDFIATYQDHSDEQILKIHAKLNDYTPEAREAIQYIIEKRGGLHKLLREQTEKERLSAEIRKLIHKGVDSSFVKTILLSDILSEEEVGKLVDNIYNDFSLFKAERSADSRTISNSMVGGIFGSLIGGALWGLLVIYTGRIYYFSYLMVLAISLLATKLSTKRTFRNPAVIIAGLISAILAIFIGEVLFALAGPRY